MNTKRKDIRKIAVPLINKTNCQLSTFSCRIPPLKCGWEAVLSAQYSVSGNIRQRTSDNYSQLTIYIRFYAIRFRVLWAFLKQNKNPLE